MNLFDLLFLALVLTALLTLLTAAGFAAAGRGGRALRILRRLGVGGAIYLAIVIFVSLVAPRREYRMGEPQCFDDWCIAATAEHISISPAGDAYTIDFRLSSRARGISQRERNIVAYLTDRDGRRYDPVARPEDAPFDALLGPGEAVGRTRFFRVPAGIRDVNLVVVHEGGFPIGWFIIGYDSWFRKAPIMRLHASTV